MQLFHPKSRAALTLGVAAVAATSAVVAATGHASATQKPDNSANTSTPIKHLVVIFDENVSYDHYFGTYPTAKNTDGTKFVASSSTPKNNNLVTSGALTSNGNAYYPQRLTPAEADTCDQNHNYGPEQKAVNNGAMNQFVQNVSVDKCSGNLYQTAGLSMDYYDGNTVTALWNYAQQFAMSDNSWDAMFGPSSPGAINLISGQTHGFREVDSKTLQQVSTPGGYAVVDEDKNGVGSVINDPDPAYDDCSDTNHTSTNTLAAATGTNVGDLLNAKGVSWGWFQGGFAPTTTAAASASGYAVCGATHANVNGNSAADYSAHHNPFQYYQSTANPHHLPPASTAEIGHDGQANHQYDMSEFGTALAANDLPAVSFLKAPEYQDGHAGYSDPIDEQNFLVNTINELQKSPDWKSTAVVISYDDSDGWYDHVAPTIKNKSNTANDSTVCTTSTAPTLAGDEDRCGPSQRLPMLVISPWSKTNYISNTYVTQPSITKFIEDNWFTPRIGGGSFDASAGSLSSMFDFTQSNNKRVILNTNGSVKSITVMGSGSTASASPTAAPTTTAAKAATSPAAQPGAKQGAPVSK